MDVGTVEATLKLKDELSAAINSAGRAVESFGQRIKASGTFIDRLDASINELIRDQRGAARASEVAAAAIAQIGGATRLTTTQVKDLSRTVAAGIDAFRAMGQEVPPSIRRVDAELKRVSGSAKQVSADAGQLGQFLNRAASAFTGFIGAQVVMRGISEGFDLIKRGAIGVNASLETSTLQFSTLLGSADAAREHVKSLFDFAAKTPFESQQVIQASRNLLVFGGAALNTKDNLSLVGNAAAAVSAPIEDVSFWVGRLYSSLQAGKPIGEAAQRLQELAILTPQTRNEIERLAQSGANADDVFRVFQDSLGKFDGAMDNLSKTFEGQLSTLRDNIDLLLAESLEPFFKESKSGLEELNEILSSSDTKRFVRDVGEAAKFSIDVIKDLREQYQALQDIITFGSTKAVREYNERRRESAELEEENARRLAETQKWLKDYAATLKPAASHTANVSQRIAQLAEVTEKARKQLADLAPGIRDSLAGAIQTGITSTKDLAEAYGISETAVKLFAKELKNTERASNDSAKALKKHAEDVAEFYEAVKKAAEKTREANESFVRDLGRKDLDVALKIREDGIKRTADAMDRGFRAFVRNQQAEVAARRNATNVLNQLTQSQFAYQVSQINQWVATEKAALDQSQANWKQASRAIDAEAGAKFIALANSSSQAQDAILAVGAAIPFGIGTGIPLIVQAKQATEAWKFSLDDLARAFAQMAQVSEGKFSGFLRAIGEFINLLNIAKEAGKGMKAGWDQIGAGIEQIRAGGEKAGAGWASVAGGVALVATNALAAVSALEAATRHTTKLKNALSGASVGAQIGKEIGGPVGALAGFGVGALVGLFRASGNARRELERLKNEFIDSAGGIEQLRIKASAAGISIDSLFKDGSKNAEQFKRQLEEVKQAIAVAEQRTAFIDAQGGLDALARHAELARVSIGEIFQAQNTTQLEAAIKRITKAFEEQQRRIDGLKIAAEGLNSELEGYLQALSKIPKADKGVFEAPEKHPGAGGVGFTGKGIDLSDAKRQLAGFALTANNVFLSLVRETGDVVGALDAIGPSLDQIREIERKLGIQVQDDNTRWLLNLREITKRYPEVMLQIRGLAGQIRGLTGAQRVTQEQFDVFGRDAKRIFDELVAKTGNADAALFLMQPTLQALWEAQQKFGLKTDEATEKLIEMAKKSGVIDTDVQPTMQDLVDILGDGTPEKPGILGVLKAMAEYLGVIIPGEAEKAAKAIGGIPAPPPPPTRDPGSQQPGPVGGHGGEYPQPGGDNPEDEPNGGYYAKGGLVRRAVKALYAAGGLFIPKGTDTVPAMLTPGEGVLNTRAMSRLGESGLNALNSGRGSVGFGGVSISPIGFLRPIQQVEDEAKRVFGISIPGAAKEGADKASSAVGQLVGDTSSMLDQLSQKIAEFKRLANEAGSLLPNERGERFAPTDGTGGIATMPLPDLGPYQDDWSHWVPKGVPVGDIIMRDGSVPSGMPTSDFSKNEITQKLPGYAGGTPGLGFTDFGPETLARLHGREAVVPEDRLGEFLAKFDGNAAGPAPIINITTFGQLTDAQQEALARQVQKAWARGGTLQKDGRTSLGVR